jgi:hypothetical protein
MHYPKTIASLVLLSSLAACGGPGYYDSNGSYVAATYTDEDHNGRDGRRYHNTIDDNYAPTEIVYSRPGYYDYYGNYVTMDRRTSIPKAMFPPRGMCRVWFPDREIDREPGIESCDGIQSRVPVGAYVIYGG